MKQSNEVIIEAPMSFTGASKRIWKLIDVDNAFVKVFFAIPAVILLLIFAYSLILCWYVVFGIFLIPYRLIRRSQRKSKRDNVRHREMLEAIAKNPK